MRISGAFRETREGRIIQQSDWKETKTPVLCCMLFLPPPSLSIHCLKAYNRTTVLFPGCSQMWLVDEEGRRHNDFVKVAWKISHFSSKQLGIGTKCLQWASIYSLDKLFLPSNTVLSERSVAFSLKLALNIVCFHSFDLFAFSLTVLFQT